MDFGRFSRCTSFSPLSVSPKHVPGTADQLQPAAKHTGVVSVMVTLGLVQQMLCSSSTPIYPRIDKPRPVPATVVQFIHSIRRKGKSVFEPLSSLGHIRLKPV